MTDTTISNNSTSAQTVTAGNRLIITSSGTLKPSGPAVTFNLSTAGTETVNNSGMIAPTSGRAFDTSGTASSAVNIVINNSSTGSIVGASDMLRTNNKALGTAGNPGSLTVSNLGSMSALSGRAFNVQEYVGLANLNISNAVGATIQSTDDAIRLTTQSTSSPAFTGTATIDNSGTIKTVGAGSGQVIDFDDVKATAAGHISIINRADGVLDAADSDSVRAGAFGQIDNYGRIQSHNANSASSGNDAIDFQANVGGVVNNYAGGSIIGARHGITGNAPVTVMNQAVITGQLGAGINLDTASTTTTTVTNYSAGVITGNAGNAVVGGTTVGVDGDGIDIDGRATITNSGTIQALGHATAAESGGTAVPRNEAIAIGGGSITNNSGGLIHSVERAITIDDSNLGNAFAATTIINHGTITGDNGEAIAITDTFADTLTNDGTINGSVNLGGGADIVNNAGTISGAVAMGEGNDTINLTGGSMTSLDGGAGTDGITVSGASTTVTLAGVTNVETLSVASGTATISNVESYTGGIAIGAGTLAFSAAASGSTSAITFGAGAGTLTLNQAAFTSGDFATQIKGLATEDRIDVTGLGANATATLGANNVLTVSNGTTSETIHLDPTQNYSSYRFHTASDGSSGIYITYTDDAAPTATSATVSTDEDTALAGTVTASDADNDALTYALGTGPAHGILTFNANGSYVYTPNADYNGADSFTFTANDGTKTSAAATISIGVAAVNDAPALTGAQAALAHGAEDTAYTVTTAQLTTGYTDVDGDTLGVNGLAASSGTVQNNGDGTYTITPAANANGPVTLSYSVTDGHGGSTAASLGYTVDAVNDAPVLTGAQATLAHGSEDTAYTVITAQLTTGYTDADGDTLGVNGLAASSGTVQNNGDGTYTITPVANANGPVTLSYTIDDGHGATAAASLAYTVDAVNDAPSVIALSNDSVAENSANGTVVGTFSTTDVDDTDGFIYTLLDDANGAFAVNATSGVLSVADGTKLDYETATTQAIDVKVTDAGGASHIEHLTIAITDVAESHGYTGTDGADTFTAPTNDAYVVNALKGNDTITTAGGNDTINGGPGNDTLSSGGGDDLFLIDPSGGYDRIDGGDGYDRISATAKLVIGLTTVSGIEEINANGFSGVTISGNTTNDTLDFSGTKLVGIASISGGAGNDTITGSSGDDTIIGGGGKDSLHGGGGNDTFLYGALPSVDSVDGGAGTDRILATANNLALNFSSITGIEEISGNGFTNVRIVGTTAADTIDLSGINVTGIGSIQGLAGADHIIGGTVGDDIIGGAGADVLTGGAGNDLFVYAAITESGLAAKADHITDFTSGSDLIDLSAIDANKALAGNQAFTFIGTDAFTGTGQVRIGTDGGHDALFINMSGNATAEFEIVFDTHVTLHQSDLIL